MFICFQKINNFLLEPFEIYFFQIISPSISHGRAHGWAGPAGIAENVCRLPTAMDLKAQTGP
jgi:hypothetical protein